MKFLTLTAAALALAVASGPSFAADTAPRPANPPPAATAPATPPAATSAAASKLDISTLRAVDDKDKNVTYNGMSVNALEDSNVEQPNGDKVGEIDRVLVDKDNKIVAVTIDAGGFLGIGTEKVVMPLNQLQYDGNKKKFITSLNKDQLKAMPHWDQSKK
jgi:hypothetical protein